MKTSLKTWLVICAIISAGIPFNTFSQTYGTFYLQSQGGVPWPFDPYGGTEPIETIDASNRIFVVEDSAEDFQFMQDLNSMSSMSMMSMDVPSPGGNGGGDYGSAFSSSFTAPDYGTNLWLQITGNSGSTADLLLSNTVADVPYEIKGISDLSKTNLLNWNSYGFILGSELTNWTTTSITATNYPNLFLGVLSWQDSLGIGIPDWWQLEHFGYVGIDIYGEPMGDGWSNLQKFQNNMDPNAFYSPLAPVVAASLNTNEIATISWQPLPGALISYTVIINDSQTGQTITNVVSSNTTSLAYDMSGETPAYLPGYSDPQFYADFDVQGNYSHGHSGTGSASLQSSVAPNGTIVLGPNGYCYLVFRQIPNDLSKIRFYRGSEQNFLYPIEGFWDWPLGYGDGFPADLPNDFFEIPASQITNGIVQIPVSEICSYGYYGLSFQTVSSNDFSSAWSRSFAYEQLFLDGRQQLKDNLRFLLRAATVGVPYEFNIIRQPTNYVYAGYYDPFDDFFWQYGEDSPTKPFQDNATYKNFLFDANNLRPSLWVTNVNGDYRYYYPLAPNTGEYYAFYFNQQGDGSTLFIDNPEYALDPVPLITTNGVTPPASYLDATSSRWIFPASSSASLGLGGKNFYGLTNSTILGVTNVNGWTVYYPGSSPHGLLYYDVVQPIFQTVDYYFASPGPIAPNSWPLVNDPMPEGGTYDLYNGSPIPFATTNKSRTLFTAVGSSIRIAGYAKMIVTNGDTNKPAYLGQYFDKAYQVDDNGNVTTNFAGIVSPYGDFYAMYPGKAQLVTMPDIDTGLRGTCTVYCVSLQLDKNHDSKMDLNFFNGTDNLPGPFAFWVNNNYDRFTRDADDNTNYDDDVPSTSTDARSPFTGVSAPDCEYQDISGHRIIPCARDLEDFARLWICGVDSNLLAGLPAGAIITLNWNDTDWPDANNPTIDLFAAADTDGGIGYLTNSATAAAQINPYSSGYIGRLGPGQSIQLNANFFGNNWRGNHFIWCGVAPGNGNLYLKISDANSNVIAQSSVAIQLKDIKQMYERWTIGDDPKNAPTTNAILSVNGLLNGRDAFKYSLPADTNTPYILFVHGWNMDTNDKNFFAEAAFKRLYWQGYQGRFGDFQWPTYWGFIGGWTALTDPRNFDSSEFSAWRSAVGLLNKLDDLNAEYPGHVYMLAHSMGNVVAGEALQLGAQQGSGELVNTYIASQAAISAHIYDSSVTTPYLLPFTYKYPSGLLSSAGTNNYGPTTPDIFVNRLTNNIAAVGRRINFYNENDFALAMPRWGFDQITKPDYIPPDNYYYYDGSTSDPAPWNHFHLAAVLGNNGPLIDIVTNLNNLYKVMSYAAESRSTALGATPITTFTSINLTDPANNIWPSSDPFNNDYQSHFWHSAEFRGDCWMQWSYWNTLLHSDSRGFNIQNP
ncbi:MAG TPA: alpha/beta hydrolase [Verrucomicrobiae bacterium]|nr:alpha/beta hydrolase [Verrucomicrobiae bacterium]